MEYGVYYGGIIIPRCFLAGEASGPDMKGKDYKHSQYQQNSGDKISSQYIYFLSKGVGGGVAGPPLWKLTTCIKH